MATANILPTALTDGLVYASAVPLTPTEADLYGGTGVQATDPVALAEGQTVVAVVKLNAQGHITGNSTFIFLQTDLGDGTWIDVAWCQWAGAAAGDGTATFVLCGGGLGAMNNAFQQSRQSGAAPATQANGSNAVPLGGRIRFTGFSKSSGGSSFAPGQTAPTVSIVYKIQNQR